MPVKSKAQLSIELAYVAGFFDGEGCVRIQVEKREGTRKLQTSLVVSATNTEIAPIQFLAKRFPGYKGKCVRIKGWLNANERIQYEWRMRGLAALHFCEAILPYSLIKKAQLEIAIEFYKQPWRSQRKTSGGGHKIRTDANVLEDLKLAQRMKELKYASC